MGITMRSLMIIHSRDDLHVSAFGEPNAFGYLISYGERYQPLLSSHPIHRNAAEAIIAGGVMLEFLQKKAVEHFAVVK